MADQDGQDGSQSGAGATGPQSGAGDAGQTGTTDSGATGGTQSGAAGDGAGTAPDPLRAEVDQLRERMRAQDQHKSKLEMELKQLKDKDLPEAAKLKRDFEEVSARAEKLEADLQEQRVQNAFLSDNTHKWRNPKIALKNIDLSRVTVDADGSVTGLKDALSALAKAEPWMLEPTKQDDEGDGDKRTFTPPVGGGRAPDGKATPDKNRFPALGRRIGR